MSMHNALPLTRHTPRHNGCRSRTIKTYAGFGEIVRGIFDFESWAPRSSRTWRLKPMPGEATLKADDNTPDQAEMEMMLQLRQRHQALGDASTSSSGLLGNEDDDDTAALYRSLQARRSQLGSLDEAQDTTDPDVAAQQAADAFLPSTPLTGTVLQAMVYAKYGLQYDLSIVKRDIPGRTLVRLNVMWQHPKQVSFALSPREFDEKMDTIAYYLRYVCVHGRVW